MAFSLRQCGLAMFCVLLFVSHIQANCLIPYVRREWRKLSKIERSEWIDAVQCLNKLPHDPALTPSVNRSISLIPPVNPNSSFWDDIAYLHMDLNFVIHFTGYFLPWHRAFVWGVENAMREKCGYTGAQPYWDWTQDASDFYHATIFDNDTESGLGGWGDPNNDYQITTGAFAKDFPVSYPAPHTVRRNYTAQPFLGLVLGPGAPPIDPEEYINTTFTASNIHYMVNSFVGDFIGFQGYFESLSGPHPGPHIILGGDMTGACLGDQSPPECFEGPKWTPNDPMFFLHHAMVDKLWYDWQNKHQSSHYAFEGGSVSTRDSAALYPIFPNGGPPFLNFSSVVPSDGLLWNDWTIWDTMDTTRGHLCYVYQ